MQERPFRVFSPDPAELLNEAIPVLRICEVPGEMSKDTRWWFKEAVLL